MMRTARRYLLVLCALAVPGWADEAGLRQTVEYMASLGSRLSGYPGGERAADYVEDRLRALDIEVVREAFSQIGRAHV